MHLTTQHVRVSLGEDEEGALVFLEDRLIALLVHLHATNEIAPNCWFVEASFEKCVSDGEISDTLDEAVAAIRQQLHS
jgi:hypothetical protein